MLNGFFEIATHAIESHSRLVKQGGVSRGSQAAQQGLRALPLAHARGKWDHEGQQCGRVRVAIQRLFCRPQRFLRAPPLFERANPRGPCGDGPRRRAKTANTLLEPPQTVFYAAAIAERIAVSASIMLPTISKTSRNAISKQCSAGVHLARENFAKDMPSERAGLFTYEYAV